MSLTGKILITGGAGFLGRGIMRAAQAQSWDCEFIVISRDEMKHYAAKRKYVARYVVCDILDAQRLTYVMAGVDTVIHAAAAKHIPVCEYQPSEALRVNLDGTRCVIDAACEAQVKNLILISTDKAVTPVNAYGASKMLAERLVFESADFPHPGGTRLVACRYGNIIGSTGSVWGAFKKQRDEDECLSVTNPQMTRYYWGVNEAVELICASMDARSGTVVLPTMKAVQMHDLAVYLSELWNLKHYRTVGQRPGEKLHEMILSTAEAERTVQFGEHNWLLFGPTKEIVSDAKPHGAFISSLATELTMDEFLAAAEDSESV